MSGSETRAIIMSIRPKWARLIYEGKKTIEVRKSCIHKWTLPCLIYESTPVMKVTGVMWFGDKIPFNHIDIFQMSDACLTDAQYREYAGPKEVYGYRIKTVRRFEEPIPVRDLGVVAPPSFYYVSVPSEVIS